MYYDFRDKNSFAVPEAARVGTRKDNRILEIFDLTGTCENTKELTLDVQDNLGVNDISKYKHDNEPLNYACATQPIKIDNDKKKI